MKRQEKQVSYETTNSYETLNKLTKHTKHVWIVLHGIGYLSRYFLKYFDELPTEENYIIAPQAPSKYYLKNEYKHVGASWLTKENTALEADNVIAYLNAVLEAENIPQHCSLHILGFSQGVSIATRWVVKQQLKCTKLVLYAGGIPNELTKKDFDFLIETKTEIQVIVGDKDEYLSPERMETEKVKIDSLFQGKAKLIIFEGGHEVKKEIINSVVI